MQATQPQQKHRALGRGYKFLTVMAGLLMTGSTLWAFIGSSPLTKAATEGDLEQVKKLIADGADVNKKDGKRGEATALHTASLFGHLEVVKYLVSKGADVKAEGEIWRSAEEPLLPLHAAFMGAQKDVVEYFVKEHGFSATKTFKTKGLLYKAGPKDKTHKLNGIHMAIYFFLPMQHSMDPKLKAMFWDPKRLYEFVRYMEKKGVAVSEWLPTIEQTDDVPAPTVFAAAQFGAVDLLKHLVERRKMAVDKEDWDQKLTHVAARSGSVATLKYLVSKGVSLTATYTQYKTNYQPINYTAVYLDDKEKAAEVVEYLLSENGGDQQHLATAWNTFRGKKNEKATGLIEAYFDEQGWGKPEASITNKKQKRPTQVGE